MWAVAESWNVVLDDATLVTVTAATDAVGVGVAGGAVVLLLPPHAAIIINATLANTDRQIRLVMTRCSCNRSPARSAALQGCPQG
jgi:hypothetical protein